MDDPCKATGLEYVLISPEEKSSILRNMTLMTVCQRQAPFLTFKPPSFMALKQNEYLSSLTFCLCKSLDEFCLGIKAFNER
jgi:hypothetical protein